MSLSSSSLPNEATQILFNKYNIFGSLEMNLQSDKLFAKLTLAMPVLIARPQAKTQGSAQPRNDSWHSVAAGSNIKYEIHTVRV